MQTFGYPYSRLQTLQGRTTEGEESPGAEMVKRRVREGPKRARVPKLLRGAEPVIVPYEGWRDPGQMQTVLSH